MFDDPTPQVFPSLLAFLSVRVEHVCRLVLGGTLPQLRLVDVTQTRPFNQLRIDEQTQQLSGGRDNTND